MEPFFFISDSDLSSSRLHISFSCEEKHTHTVPVRMFHGTDQGQQQSPQRLWESHDMYIRQRGIGRPAAQGKVTVSSQPLRLPINHSPLQLHTQQDRRHLEDTAKHTWERTGLSFASEGFFTAPRISTSKMTSWHPLTFEVWKLGGWGETGD